MECTLMFLAACLMFSGVHGASESMSCSTVNGKTICNKETSEGNTAVAASEARNQGGSSFQRTYAGAGGPTQWGSSSQTMTGRPSGESSHISPFMGYPNYFSGSQAEASGFAGGSLPRALGYEAALPVSPYSFADAQAGASTFAGRPSGNPGYALPLPGYPNSFADSQATAGTPGYAPPCPSSPNSFADSQATAGAFADGTPGYAPPFPSSPNSFADSQATAGRPPVAPHSPGSSNSFSGSEAGASAFAGGGPFVASGFAFSPNLFTGAQAGGGAFAGGGIAVAGNIPFSSHGVDYPIEDYDAFGGAPAQGRNFAGPVPVPSNPFEFVNRFMGRGPAVGGFAAAGAFPFGRR